MTALVEYRPTRVALSGADLDYVIDLVKASGDEDEHKLFESLTPTRTKGEYEIRSGPHVGRLGLPSGAWLDLVSRFDFGDVIELIRRASRLPFRHDALRVPTDAAETLVDVIATALAREIERLVGAGLAKGYRKRQFERPPYPGVLDVNRHLSRFAGRADRLVTVASRLTKDIDINRALAAALEVLRRVPLTPAPAARIARVAPAFRGVRLVPFRPDAVNALHLTLLTKRYTDALGLAEIVLRSQSLAPRLNTRIGASVVFSMPKIWEAYVGEAVRLAWPPEFGVENGYGFDLTAGGAFPAEADVIVRAGKSVVALYDAKYKWIETAPARADIYQMVTYCERLGLSEATLVYPSREPVRRTVTVGERSIHIVGLSGPGRGENRVDHLVAEGAPATLALAGPA